MGNIAEYLERLQELTQQNLEILRAINDSFFTKREHIQVSVGDAKYALPSFVALENKINNLQENFSNLVYAPKTGEATFNVDGNSRTIELKGYTCTPNRLVINAADIPGFSVEQNDIFKDLLTPNPYIRIDLQSLPNDITTVNVRKVAFKSSELQNIINTKLAGGSIVSINWADLYKILSIYKEDNDFIQYDTVRQLPIRQNIGSGTYIIKSIDNDEVDSINYEEYITLTLHEDLKYTLFDETIEKYFAVGDQLVTFDDSAKMEIVEVNHAARQIKVKVLNGDYLNLVADPDGDLSSDMCKLKYFSAVDYDADKYINIPLEEDRYIAIFISPLNSRMNVQAPWGGGILVDTNEIRWTADGMTRFKDYYETNIRNVGDVLYEVSAEMTNSIMKYGEDDFKTFVNYKPVLDTSKLKVLQINTHLNNSTTVKNIRSLYAQKITCNTNLTEVQDKITEINKNLSEISFDDSTGIRQTYEAQLSQYNKRRAELSTSLSKIINDINNAVNNSTIPLENAKYRIRGYYDWFIDDENIDQVLAKFWNHIHGIKVQYRYKNQDMETGTAVSIDDKFIFSDWNTMDSKTLIKTPTYRGGYSFAYPQYETDNGGSSQDNGRINEPSFNQIDIPISQGETVDIRLKIIWDFGFPFIETTSDWSEIVNIPFPEEYTKDVKLTDIIAQNNLDYESDMLKNILKDNGTNAHIEDKITDQDAVFYHKPENISSGFYTAERRIIPLRDKLIQLDQNIVQLQDMVNNTSNNVLDCVAIIDGVDYDIYPDRENTIVLPEYRSTAESNELALSSDDASNRVHTSSIILKLTNNSEHTSFIYSMFPANEDIDLNDLKNKKFDVTEFCKIGNIKSEHRGVYLGYAKQVGTGDNIKVETDFTLQTANQWCTFRVKDVYSGAPYYADYKTDGSGATLANQLNIITKPNSDTLNWFSELNKVNKSGLIIYPYLQDKDALKIPGNNTYNKITLNPGESVMVTIMAHYKFDIDNNSNNDALKAHSIYKYLSFDIRTSPYNDPTTYVIKICANNTYTVQDKIYRTGRTRLINRSTLSDDNKLYKS